jgi:PhoH-like ATPase
MSDTTEAKPRRTRRATTRRDRVVLDTSVLIADPSSLLAFAACDVVIPLTVIEELDGLKSRADDVGRSARTVLRTIEELRVAHGGRLDEEHPAQLPGEATLRIALNAVNFDQLAEHFLDPSKPDNRIIGAALGQRPNGPVEIVSNDAALRIKASHVGIDAKEFLPGATYRQDTVPAGWHTLETASAVIDELHRDREVPLERLGDGAREWYDNEFAVLRAGSQSGLARVRHGRLQLLGHDSPEAWGLRARSKEQRFALELLLNPEVKIVALDGMAGTGKTLLAMAAGLEQVMERPQRYQRLSVYRPIIAVGKQELGFLPGSKEEKLDPWMAAIHDAVVALTDRRSADDAQQLMTEMGERGLLTMESVTFLRGRSLHRAYVLVDEAQNLEPATLKTILTRIGEDTKVVFTGDTSQIDAPFLSEHNNAIALLIAAFGGGRAGSLFGHVRLREGERSEVASLAARLL